MTAASALGSKASSRARAASIDGNSVNVKLHHRKDKYGAIPLFSEIGESLGELGHGRCGKVKKVAWDGGYAAVKEFSLRGDEDETRYFFDVYKKELDILISLRELWGTHVPALLFHKPWTAGPLIGLQLGEPIKEDDLSRWSSEDKDMVAQTIDTIREHGWKQTDLRGRNFVRLSSDGKKYIAMIDFESVVRV
jgi:hypothetical protein